MRQNMNFITKRLFKRKKRIFIYISITFTKPNKINTKAICKHLQTETDDYKRLTTD